jgi:SAM-dependent methyltransferase
MNSSTSAMPVDSAASDATAKRELFLASVLFLFIELLFIRWFPAQVLFLTFFTNTVLLASFIGLSLGCLAARHKRDYLSWTPALLLCCVGAGASMEWLRLTLQDVINLGNNKTSPQMVYFGAEVRVQDVAKFVVPIEVVVAFFFLLIAATLIGVGQALGRRFRAVSDPVQAYIINIAGSLIGVLLFQVFATHLSPVWWFTAVSLGLIMLLMRDTKRHRLSIALAVAVPVALYVPDATSLGIIRQQFPLETWSPYYRINYSPSNRTIVVNLIGQQTMVSRNEPYPAYALPYLLNRDAGQRQFRDILIIGAGSGNDVSRALQWSPQNAHIDAVEIDPVIQKLGVRRHPDRPYSDPRVATYVTDGRNFLRSTSKQYDLIVFALIDSLVLHSSASNIRLESYLFTEEAMQDVRRRLRPNGVFVMYNYFRQGWIVSRLVHIVHDAFGRQPLVLGLPQQDLITPDARAEGFTILFAGRRAYDFESAFKQRGSYSIPTGVALGTSTPYGFGVSKADGQMRLRPSNVQIPGDLRPATDSWPFLYLRNPMIPSFYWRGMLVIGLISLVLLRVFGWRTDQAQLTRTNGVMFLLGAGFMLLETKAVVHMALVFGSTWTVNTAVFAGLLIVILLANIYVAQKKPQRLAPFYTGLLLTLLLNAGIPLNSFLGLPLAIGNIAACALVISPVFFAGIVFAVLLKRTVEPEQALAYNTAGAVLGGIAETTSLLIGFQYLVLLAAVLYVTAWFMTRGRHCLPLNVGASE